MTEQLKVYHNKPLIFTIDNILTAEECNLIIEKCKDKMERAQIGTGDKSKNEFPILFCLQTYS